MVAPREVSASQSPQLTSQVSPLASPCVLKALAVQRRLSHGPFSSRTTGVCKLSVVSTPIPYTVKPEIREVWAYIWDPTCSCGGTLIGVCIRFPWSLLTITGPERWPMGSLSLSWSLLFPPKPIRCFTTAQVWSTFSLVFSSPHHLWSCPWLKLWYPFLFWFSLCCISWAL